MHSEEMEVIRFATLKLAKGVKGVLPLATFARALAYLPGWGVREGSMALPVYGFLSYGDTPEQQTGKEFVVTRALQRLTPPGHVFTSPLTTSDPIRIGLTRAGREAGTELVSVESVQAKIHVLPKGTKGPSMVQDGALYGTAPRLVAPDTNEWTGQFKGERHVAMDRLWLGVPTWEVYAPDGTHAHLVRWHVLGAVKARRKNAPPEIVPEPAEPVYENGVDAVWSWIYKPERGLTQAVKAWLDALPGEVREDAVRPPSERDASNTGECQICARRQKLAWRGKVPRLVDHGFEFPDSDHWRSGMRGQRENSCFGVGYLPYEWGTEAIVAYLNRLAVHEKSVVAQRARLQTGTVPVHAVVRGSFEHEYELVVYPDGRNALVQADPKDPHREPWEVPVTEGQEVQVARYVLEVTRGGMQRRKIEFKTFVRTQRYADVLARKIESVNVELDRVRATIHDYTARRDAWTKKPLRGNPEGVPPPKRKA